MQEDRSNREWCEVAGSPRRLVCSATEAVSECADRLYREAEEVRGVVDGGVRVHDSESFEHESTGLVAGGGHRLLDQHFPWCAEQDTRM